MPQGLYKITSYDELYRPYDKSGRELKHPDFVKLPVKPKGDGLQRLLEHKRGLEVFAIWCLLLEKATDEKKPENRGKLLNHREEPATIQDIAKGISLKGKEKLVAYALNILSTIGWVIYEGERDIMSQNGDTMSPNITKLNLTKDNLTKDNISPPTPHYWEKFWELYPKKQKEKAAKEQWMLLCLTEELFKKIMAGLERWRKSEQWQNPRYIPSPDKWLQNQQWNDEIIEGTKNGRKDRTFSKSSRVGRSVEV